jgi:radical SAM superfamily enzyme YgiQ (UPF0313 family)
MCHVLLAEPPSRMQRLQHLRTRKPHLGAPLPFIYISPYLLSAGHEVEIIDLRISPVKLFCQYLREREPVVVGISVMPGSALLQSIKLSQLVKQYSPKSRVVWGGAFPSLHVEFCLTIPEVDYVVVGDGEETLTELVQALVDGPDENSHQVEGLGYRRNGLVVKTEAREPVDLNRKPIGAWSLVEEYMEYYLGPRGYLAVNTARGCPYRCSFCYNNLLYRGHKRYRVKSIDSVLAEVEYLTRRYAISKIQFMDDEFLVGRRRGLELLAAIRGRQPSIKFHIAARADKLNQERITRGLSELGCESTFIGAETASPEQLELINKGATTTHLVDAAKLCREYNIINTYSFTCGYPGETERDLQASVSMAQLLKQIDPRSQSVMEIVSPISGTPLFAELDGRGLIPRLSPGIRPDSLQDVSGH